MKNINRLILLIIITAVNLYSQRTVTLDNAIEMALKNNFDIKISANNVLSANESKNPGSAGLLPSIDLTGNAQHTKINSKQNSKSVNLSAGVSLNYTIFNGGYNTTRYEILKTQLDKAELQNKQLIENVILNVVQTYLTTAKSLEILNTHKSFLMTSAERLKRIKTGTEFGSKSRIDVLNAQVNFNTDSVKYMNLMQDFEKNRMELAELISTEWEEPVFIIKTDITLYENFDIDELVKEVVKNNKDMLIQKTALTESEQNIVLAKSKWFPKLTLTSSYTKNFTNPMWYSPYSTSREWQTGLSLNFSLFDGGARSSEIEKAKITKESQSYLLRQKKMKLEKELRLLYSNYQNGLRNIEAETENLSASKLNYDMSLELYKTGQITNTQFREAEQNYLQAKTNISSAKYSTKTIEYEILKMSGRLLKINNSGN